MEKGSIIDAQIEFNEWSHGTYSCVIKGKEYWASSEAWLYAIKRALDVNYGVIIKKPKHHD